MRRLTIVAVLLATLVPLTALAQATDIEDLTPEQVDELQALVARANAATEAGALDEAIEFRRRCLSILDDPRIRVRLARALRDIGHTPEAVIEYERAARAEGNPVPVARVELEELLEAHPGDLYVTVDPPAAVVTVDGVDVGELADGTITISRVAGEYDVQVTADGHIPASSAVTFDPDETGTWDVRLVPIAEPETLVIAPEAGTDADATAATVVESPPDASRSYAAPIVFGSLAVGTAATGLVFWIKAANDDARHERLMGNSDSDPHEAGDAGVDAERNQWIAAGLGSGAAVLAGCAIYTLVRGGRDRSDESALSITPVAGRTFSGARLRVVW